MLHTHFRTRSKRKQKSRLLLVCFLLLQTLVYPQQDNYIIKQYNSENGLPQNSVKAIKFDKSGFCWLATESGIVRFDNHNFKHYGSDNIKGLNSERIVAIMTDTAGTIVAQGLDYRQGNIGTDPQKPGR